MGHSCIDGKHIIRLRCESLRADTHLAGSGQNHVELKKLMDMRLYDPQPPHGTTQRVAFLKIHNGIVL